MSELLFEIGCEELPASYAIEALAALPAIVARELSERGLKVEAKDVRTAGTPRRLAIGVASLPETTPKVKKTQLGPPKAAPAQAAAGFAAKLGLKPSDLKVEKTDKGEYWAAEVTEGGRATREVLAEALPKVIESIPFPRSMRWASLESKFARPVRWLLAAYAGKPVPFEWGGTRADTKTHGHRFLAPGAATATSWSEWEKALEKAHVVADVAKRREKVKALAAAAAKEKGGAIEPDEKLLDTVTFLVEEPTAITGSFEKALLELPKDVIVTPMKHHQRYFPVVDGKGALLPFFVTMAATPPNDAKVVAKGNERVLRARLADAAYFFKLDTARKLGDMLAELSQVTFQDKLGTYAAKVQRMKNVAVSLHQAIGGTKNINTDIDLAIELSKADLRSKMVFEFPELQGVMGREYARREGRPAEIVEAIAEHYLPRFAGDKLPQTEIGAIVGLADRLDTIAGLFTLGERPSGSSDPYGLRRHALALIAIIRDRKYRLQIRELLEGVAHQYGNQFVAEQSRKGAQEAAEFIKDRLSVTLRDEGLAYDAVEAALSARFEDVNDACARAKALAGEKKKPGFDKIATVFKRAANIIADAPAGDLGATLDASLFAHAAEKALFSRLGEVERDVQAAKGKGDWSAALGKAGELNKPIDDLFLGVMVMDKDVRLRRNRLALLKRVVDLFADVADFRKIVV